MQPRGEDDLRGILNSALKAFDTSAANEVRQALAEKAAEIDPSPFYIVSVVRTADGTITKERVETIPESAQRVWEEQYSYLSGESRRILRLARVVDECRLPLQGWLIRGLAESVYDQDDIAYADGIQQLVDSHWIVVPPETDVRNKGVLFKIHDIQLEAIPIDLDRRIADVSEFLCSDVDRHIRVDQDHLVALHHQFAVSLSQIDPDYHEDVAERHYQELLGDDGLAPENADVHYNYAIFSGEIGRVECAYKHYERATELDSDHVGAYTRLAGLQYKEGDYLNAKQYFKRAVQLNPGHADTRTGFGCTLKETGDSSKAKTQLEVAVDLNPESVYAHHEYANLLRDEFPDSADLAEQQYSTAIQHDHKRPALYSDFAQLLAHQKRFDEVRWCLSTAVSLWLKDDEKRAAISGLKRLVYLSKLTDDYHDAIEYCERALELAREPDLGDDGEAERELQSLYARLEGRNAEQRIPELYRYGLKWFVTQKGTEGTILLREAWMIRNEFDVGTDAHQLALSAGVWDLVLSLLLVDSHDIDPIEWRVTKLLEDREHLRLLPQFVFGHLSQVDDRIEISSNDIDRVPIETVEERLDEGGDEYWNLEARALELYSRANMD